MIALPGQPGRLAVTLDTDLAVAGSDAGQVDPSLPTTDIEVSVVVADETGLHRFAGPAIGLKADGSRVTIDMTATVDARQYRVSGPLRLEAIEVKLVGPGMNAATGTVRLRSLESSDSTAGGQWQTVDLGLGSAGWGWSRVFNQTVTAYSPPSGSPGLVSVGPADTDVQAGDGVMVRYWAVPSGSNAIPALANRQLLDASGALEGDTILASRLGFESPLTIVAIVDGFPTLDPSKPLLVVDRAAIGLIDYATWGLIDTPGEWWLTVSPGTEGAVVTALGSGPYSAASVISRAQIEASQSADPVSLAVIGALLLGSLAAALIAAIGRTDMWNEGTTMGSRIFVATGPAARPWPALPGCGRDARRRGGRAARLRSDGRHRTRPSDRLVVDSLCIADTERSGRRPSAGSGRALADDLHAGNSGPGGARARGHRVDPRIRHRVGRRRLAQPGR